MTSSPIYDTPTHSHPSNYITQIRCRRKTKALTCTSIFLQLLVLIVLGFILYFTYKVHAEGVVSTTKNVIKLKKHINRFVTDILKTESISSLKRFFFGPLHNTTSQNDTKPKANTASDNSMENQDSPGVSEDSLSETLGQILRLLRNPISKSSGDNHGTSILDSTTEDDSLFHEYHSGERDRSDGRTSSDYYSGANEGERWTETQGSGLATTRSYYTSEWRTSPSVESSQNQGTHESYTERNSNLKVRSETGESNHLGEVSSIFDHVLLPGSEQMHGGIRHPDEWRDSRQVGGKGTRITWPTDEDYPIPMPSFFETLHRDKRKVQHRIHVASELQGVNPGTSSRAEFISTGHGRQGHSMGIDENRRRKRNLRSIPDSVNIDKTKGSDRHHGGSGHYTTHGDNNGRQYDTYTNNHKAEYLGVRHINIDPEVPRDAPYTTLSQTGQVVTDVSLSIIYTTFNSSILKTHIAKARELLTFIKTAINTLSSYKHAKTPANDAPAAQLLLDTSDSITMFEERCVKLWSISTSMAGDVKVKDSLLDVNERMTLDEYASLVFPETSAMKAPVPEELRMPGRTYYTWSELLRRFPRPQCFNYESKVNCTHEEEQRVELFHLATSYVIFNDSSVLPAIEDLLNTLEVDVLTPPSTYQTELSQDQKSQDSVLSVGVRLLGIVISLFSGLTYAGVLGGPSTQEINRVIFDENTPVGPVNEKTKTLEEIDRKVHKEPANGHERILERLIDRATANVGRMNEILRTHKYNDYQTFGSYEPGSQRLANEHYLNLGMTFAQTIVHQIDHYLNYGNMLATSFEQALSGTVPMELFPPADVIKSLNYIQSKKSSQYSLIFDDNYKDVPQFYSMKVYVTSHPKDPATFILSVIIPMTNRRETYALYEYHDDPIFVGPENLLLRIKPETRLVMTDHQNGVIRALYPEDLSQCTKINLKYLCPDIKLFVRKDTCLTGLIRNHPETIFGLCDLEFDTQKGTLVRRFGINQYVFRSNRTQTIKFSCDGVSNTYVETILKGQNRLYIPKGCTATVDTIYISNTGELTSGDPSVGQPYLHFPLIDNLAQMWKLLEKRFEQFDFSAKQRKNIVKIVQKRNQPVTIQELNQILVSQSSKANKLTELLTYFTFVVMILTMITLMYIYKRLLNRERFKTLFQKNNVTTQRSRIATNALVRMNSDIPTVQIVDPPNYPAPSYTDSPGSQRRLIPANRQLFAPMMESIRNFKPENLRRSQAELQSQTESEEPKETQVNKASIEEL